MIEEKQKFSNIWLWLLLLLINFWMLYAVIQQLIFKIPVGSNPAPDLGLVVAFLTTFSILVLFKIMYLKVLGNKTTLTIIFFPFVRKEIPIKDIQRVEVVTYNSLMEYGGWGIRYGGQGWAYNVGGNHGLRITLHNGKSILVGIRNKEQFENYINTI